MKVEDTIRIETGRDTVWKVTVDVEKWPQWATHFQTIRRGESGGFQLGSSAWIKQKGMGETKWVVTAFEDQTSFSWEAKMAGIQMRATHELKGVEEEVENTLRLEASGMLPFLFGPILKRQIKKSLQLENMGLKRFCEGK